MADFLFRGSLRDLDPQLHALTELEAERQYRKLIMIASESTAPNAVLEALGSRFHNLYAEGYPDDDTRLMAEAQIFDYPARLAHYRRYADPRYYKGVEYANTVEALARRRCAEAFAANGLTADQLFVNVQALSGAPANNAIYHALVNPGDTIMGMNLLFGGHLTHGSPVNRSGKYYKVVPYTFDPATGKIDMEQVARLAREHKPKMMIVGYSSYPWAADFRAFRAIADEVGAYLLADMAHVAGLIAAGVYPSPIGIAHVTSFTTHKTLNGPRGAAIITHDAALAKKIDRAVFPGEQGGPHVNVFAALALAFKLAQTPEFKTLQTQTVKNAQRMVARFQQLGFTIPFGGTESHLFNLDCKTITGPDGTPLMGDLAARLLDIAGVVCNRNTIPGDKSALNPSGLRLGTPWITQRGFTETECDTLTEAIAQVLRACQPYKYPGRKGDLFRAKVDFEAFENAKLTLRNLALNAGIDFTPTQHGYPHFYYVDDPAPAAPFGALMITGARAADFLYWATTSDVYALAVGATQPTRLHLPGDESVEGALTRTTAGFTLTVPSALASRVAAWLRGLSDGYTDFDPTDRQRKLPGPVLVETPQGVAALPPLTGLALDPTKPYFIGMSPWAVDTPPALPPFRWEDPTDPPLKRTALHATHQALGGRMVPFAGWEMPVQYTGVIEEHTATRSAAGLFDVSHMGVWDVAGPNAGVFLDALIGNEASALAPGESQYAHLLAPNAHVLDDCYVYRLSAERFLFVVNASNDDKDWAWAQAVLAGTVMLDPARPWAQAPGRAGTILRNLRDPQHGPAMRVDIALQGPKSREIVLALGGDPATVRRVKALKRTDVCEATLGGFDLIVARTGYTGETMGFELFVHPDRAVDLWNALLTAGAPLGLKPCGLAARDSLRTEAGLPLYGDELAGHLDLGVGDAGFDSYVKAYKPWFIGRTRFLEQEKARTAEVTRFRFDVKSGRMAHNGDPISDSAGRIIGEVTCCSIDTQAFRSGQAYLPLTHLAEGTPLRVHQGAAEVYARTRPASVAELEAALQAAGAKARPPEAATVLSRFPKKKAA